MRKSALVLLLAGLLDAGVVTRLAAADLDGRGDKGFGAGLMLGEPTGLNVKYWIDEHYAVDGAVGCSFEGQNNLELHADYLYHFFDVIKVPEGRLPIYAGAGLRYKVRDDKDDKFGIRTVAGLDYIFEKAPVDVFFEVEPVFNVTPDFDVDVTVAIGARFWF
jgi:hypothetical protein